jgi:hypothetical protein
MCTAGAFFLADASADSALHVMKRCERAGIRVDVPTNFKGHVKNMLPRLRP